MGREIGLLIYSSCVYTDTLQRVWRQLEDCSWSDTYTKNTRYQSETYRRKGREGQGKEYDVWREKDVGYW
jgi:hypothetical protein